jgi:Ca2+-binding EF-hand superfamily protein
VEAKDRGNDLKDIGHVNEDIDDIDDMGGTYTDSLRSWVRSVASNNVSEAFILGAIFLNSIFIGIQLQYSVDNPQNPNPPFMRVVEYLFTATFTIELAGRLYTTNTLDFFCGSNWLWNWLDAVIVLSSLIEVGIEVVEEVTGGGGHNGGSFTNLRIVRIIRVTRFVRIGRVVRIMRFIRALRTLVYSIGCTLKSLIWSLILLALIVYVFAIIVTQSSDAWLTSEAELLVPADSGTGCGIVLSDSQAYVRDVNSIRRMYGSLSTSMFTLFKAVSGGLDWHEAIDPLDRLGWPYTAIVTLYVTFVIFAVLNVITSVFCQSAIESAQHDAEMAIQNQIQNKQFFIDRVTRLFKDMDKRDSGQITLQEFEDHLESEHVQAYFATLELNTADAWTLFKLIDSDETDVIDIEEFVMGCLRLKGSARSIDVAKLMSDSRQLQRALQSFSGHVEEQLLQISQLMLMSIHSQRSNGATPPTTLTRFHDASDQKQKPLPKPQACESEVCDEDLENFVATAIQVVPTKRVQPGAGTVACMV